MFSLCNKLFVLEFASGFSFCFDESMIVNYSGYVIWYSYYVCSEREGMHFIIKLNPGVYLNDCVFSLL